MPYEVKEKVAPLEDKSKRPPKNPISQTPSYSISFSSSITDGFNYDYPSRNSVALSLSQQKGKELNSFKSNTAITTSPSAQLSQRGVEWSGGNNILSSNPSFSPNMANNQYDMGKTRPEWLTGSQHRPTRLREEYCQFYGCHRNVNDGSGDQHQHRCEQCNFVFCREVRYA